MGHDDVDAVADHVDDMLSGVLHQLELLLRAVAESVAAEGDDYGRTVTFLIWHRVYLLACLQKTILCRSIRCQPSH